MAGNVIKTVLWLSVLVILCVSCASSRKTVREDVREGRVSAVDSVATRSEAHSALAWVGECENLRVVIEEYETGKTGKTGKYREISEFFPICDTSATAVVGKRQPQACTPTLKRRIVIERERQREGKSEESVVRSDSVGVQRNDSLNAEKNFDSDSSLDVNQPTPCWLLYALVIVAVPVVMKWASRK